MSGRIAREGLRWPTTSGCSAGMCLHTTNMGLLDHAAVQVAAQVQQRLAAAAHGPAIDHPGRRQLAGQRQAGALDGVEHLGAEDLGQRLVV
jgi:hypothetical protein